MREIIIDTDEYYQFSSGSSYPIIIYEYFGDGKVEKLHEGHVDSCLNYLCDLQDVSHIWTDNDKERITRTLKFYLRGKGIRTDINWNAYWHIKESGFRKRLISYWIEMKP